MAGLLRVHVMPTFADRAVAAITPGDVRRFIADKVASGSAPGTVRGAREIHRGDYVDPRLGRTLFS